MYSISWSMALAPWVWFRLYRLSLTIATISLISTLLKEVLSIGIVDAHNTGGGPVAPLG
jgi:hypothetical protein